MEIPAGVDSGTQVRLAGEGEPGVNGGPHGSLFLVLDVKPHKFFKRRENDIILNLDINLAQATLGADVQIPTLDGEDKLQHPGRHAARQGLQAEGQGRAAPPPEGARGDQLVIINVEIPAKLTKEQRELFEKLAETLGTQSRPKEKGFLDWLNETLGG